MSEKIISGSKYQEPGTKSQEPRRINLHLPHPKSSLLPSLSGEGLGVRCSLAVLLFTPYSVLSTIFKFDLRLTLITFYFLLFTQFPLHAQLLTPLSGEMNRRVEYRISQVSPEYFTLIKPYLQTDSIYPSFNNNPKPSSWLKRKLFYQSLVEVDSGDLYLYFDPVFDFSLGRDNSGRSIYTNTRGFIAGGRLGKNFAFGTSFYENQAIFPNYIHNNLQNKIITGQGMGRLNGQTWDYAHSSGYLSYSPGKALNIQLGQGKNFIGDGYRSLLLSDISYNYPYSRVTFLSKKIMYSWMLGIIQDLNVKKGNEKYTYGKRMISSIVLSADITSKIQASLIKNTIFNNPDTLGNFNFRFQEFNPILLPFNSENTHSIWGLNLKVIICTNLWLYGQLIFDNLTNNGDINKGFQLGAKYFNAFGLNGFYLQAEFNSIDPETYTSDNKTLNWMHYAEPLAHLYGNNFREGIFHLIYNWKRWQFDNLSQFSKQLDNNNISGSELLYPFPSLNKTRVLHNNIQLMWFLNPKTTAHFSLGYTIHIEKNSEIQSTYGFVNFSFRTALFNNYLY
jgi:hypothetical protein